MRVRQELWKSRKVPLTCSAPRLSHFHQVSKCFADKIHLQEQLNRRFEILPETFNIVFSSADPPILLMDLGPRDVFSSIVLRFSKAHEHLRTYDQQFEADSSWRLGLTDIIIASLLH